MADFQESDPGSKKVEWWRTVNVEVNCETMGTH